DHDVFLNTLQNNGPVAAFSLGVGNFISAVPVLNLSFEAAQAFAALAVAAFALTTLDTATRLARYSFQEFFEVSTKEENPKWNNRFTATAVSVFVGIALTFSGQTMAIWPIFGSANQMLAALALLAITVWLSHLKKSYTFTIIPMYFMFAVTLAALLMLFYNNLVHNNNIVLALISLFLFLLAIVLGVKAYKAIRLEESLIKPIT
ncbi:MAG: carbon starvation protein A, partial [Melioribacteraceae bacterium]|nr:carbon starvation protein A [Melioribacteraceae bacterium]